MTKPAAAWREAPPRLEGRHKVTGFARYTADVRLPGQIFGGILRSDRANAAVRLNADKVHEVPGVHAVLTPADLPAMEPGNDWYDEQVATLVTRARFVGDELAAVAADSEEAVEDALRAFEVTYEEQPAVAEMQAAQADKAPIIHDGAQNNRAGEPDVYERGDVESALKSAEVLVELECTTPAALHNALEPHGCNACWDGETLNLWVSTQGVFSVRDGIADKLGLPLNKVIVHCQHVGGGFGAKQIDWKQSLIAALLSQKTGRPVKLMLDREAENLAVGNRNSTRQTVRLGANSNGLLTAIDVQVDVNVGAYKPAGEASPVTGPYQSLYTCDNVRTRQTAWYTNLGPAVAFRGPGFVEGHFGLEQAMDALARRLDMDPFALREKNYSDHDQLAGKPYSSPEALRRCCERAREAFDWQWPSPQSQQQNGSHLRRGIGMSSNIWMVGGSTPPGQAEVSMEEDGSVALRTGTQDIGTGTRTVLAQIAAETLGIDLAKISVALGDTSSELRSPTSAGSTTLPTLGPAVHNAALQLKERLLGQAAQILQTPRDKLVITEGRVKPEGTDDEHSVSLQQLAEEAEPGSLQCTSTFLGEDDEADHTDSALRTFAAQCAEVEVNTRTGEVTVLRVVCAPDCGHIINRRLADSQVIGGVTQGLGYALTEQRITDPRSAIVLNANLEDYLVPTAADIAPVTHAAVDLFDKAENVLGAKGLGEPPMIGVAPAIAAAIFDAVGVRVTEIPVTRQRLLQALATESRP